jgi:hypothetical protein
MASNLTKRLDRLERLIRERTVASTHPLYVRDIPEGVDPSRVVLVVRAYVDPPERGEETLPEAPKEAAEEVASKRPDRFSRYIEYPNLGIV